MIPERLLQARPMHRPARPAWLRAGDIPDLQLVAGVGGYEVDVLIRRLPDRRLEVVGQVTGAERVHEAVAGLSLRLYDTQAMTCAARTTTDPFGEFHLRGLPDARYVLALGEGRDAPCLLVHEGGGHVARQTGV